MPSSLIREIRCILSALLYQLCVYRNGNTVTGISALYRVDKSLIYGYCYWFSSRIWIFSHMLANITRRWWCWCLSFSDGTLPKCCKNTRPDSVVTTWQHGWDDGRSPVSHWGMLFRVFLVLLGYCSLWGSNLKPGVYIAICRDHNYL